MQKRIMGIGVLNLMAQIYEDDGGFGEGNKAVYEMLGDMFPDIWTAVQSPVEYNRAGGIIWINRKATPGEAAGA